MPFSTLIKGAVQKEAAPLLYKENMIQWGHEKRKKRSRIQTICDEPDEPDAAEL
jgi:hypothetical protein